jgi:hypothetical protein
LASRTWSILTSAAAAAAAAEGIGEEKEIAKAAAIIGGAEADGVRGDGARGDGATIAR